MTARPAPGGPRRPSALRRLARDEGGATTISFVLWVPFFTTMLMVVADMSLILTASASMQHAASETARATSRGVISQGDADAFARDRLLLGARADYTVAVRVDTDVTVDLTVPAPSISAFGFFDAVLPAGLTASAVVRREVL